MSKKVPRNWLQDNIKHIIEDDYLEISKSKGCDILSKLDENSKKLAKRWQDSNRTDFSFYSDKDYLYEGILCYHINSINSVKTSINYFSKILGMNLSEKTALDVYNGPGLTTARLQYSGLQMSYFNDVDDQIKSTNAISIANDLGTPTNYKTISAIEGNMFDIVYCLEVLEHIRDPLILVRDIIKFIKQDGFYVETTSFSSPNYPGHFETYFDLDKNELKGRGIKAAYYKLLKSEGFEKVYTGFNARPNIWMKN